MPSSPQTRANIIDAVENFLRDSTNAIWAAADIGKYLDDALREVSVAVPYIRRVIYQIESRTGTASSTSAGYLVDATKSPFASTDTKKMVYNTTEKTRGVITTYSDTTTVGVVPDIFTSGDGYEIYNKGCYNKRQVNIENDDDFVWCLGAVYPIDPIYDGVPPLHMMHNVKILNDRKIANIDVSYLDDSGATRADKDVAIYFATQHRLNPMTDLAGATNGSTAAAATSMSITGIGTTETVYKDTLLTVALVAGISSRHIYKVTADVTASGGAATISFHPALEATVAATAVVTFIGSTLTPELEQIVVQITAGEALMSEGISKINAFSRGGQNAPARYYEIGERTAEKGRRKLKSLIDVSLRANKVLAR